MKLVRMRDLSRSLGIPPNTWRKWISEDPQLAVYIRGGPGGGAWWIRVDRLIGRPGIDMSTAYTLESARWIKAVTLAEMAGIPRKTVANWCRSRPGFAKRIGRVYYIDLVQFGADPSQVARLTRASRAKSNTQDSDGPTSAAP